MSGPLKTLVDSGKTIITILEKGTFKLDLYYPLSPVITVWAGPNLYEFICLQRSHACEIFIYIYFLESCFFTSNIQGATSLEPLTSHISTEGFYRPILITFAGLQSLFFLHVPFFNQESHH